MLTAGIACQLDERLTMKRFAHMIVAAGALAGAVFGLAPAASAAPTNVGSAQNTVDRLTGLGYNVAINGSRTAPLSECLVLGVHPDDPGTVVASQFTTIWVDISCPPTNN
jgi:hypothetical protein